MSTPASSGQPDLDALRQRFAVLLLPAQRWLVTVARHRRGCQRASCPRTSCPSCVCSCGLDAAITSALDSAALAAGRGTPTTRRRAREAGNSVAAVRR